MRRTFFMKTAFVLVAMIACAAWCTSLYAEEPAKVTRKVLLKRDTTIPEKEVILVAVVIQPGAEEGRHTHPAELYVVVQEGAIVLECEGKEDMTFKAGDAFSVAPGKIHNAKNNGTIAAKLTAFFVAEKGKPLSSPAK